MPPILVVILVAVAVVAGLWFLLARKPALPPATTRDAIPATKPEPAILEKPAEEGARVDSVAPAVEIDGAVVPAEPILVPESPPAEEEPISEVAQIAAITPEPIVEPTPAPVLPEPIVEPTPEPSTPEPSTPEPSTPQPSTPQPSTPQPSTPPIAATSDASKPKLFAPPRTATPAPTLKPKPALIEPTPKPAILEPAGSAPVPKPVVPEPIAAPVPMPVDKPKLQTREQREQAELADKKTERDRYRLGLKKTKKGFIAKLAQLFRGKPKVSDELKDEIEEVLFTADIGTKTASALLQSVTAELDKKEVADPDAVWAVIREKALAILDIDAKPIDYEPTIRPYTLLMIGVNGVGKTTTIGKLAARHVEAGRKTLMVAGDTFRAAAGEQLEVWARRVGCDIHLGKDGADPSAVLFDGIMRGRNEGYDVVLCDTAGRLHTRKELMDELGKMGRAASKALSKGRDEMDPHDTFLVLDATIGQNALAQAQLFKETMNFSGLVLTKLDGTAKGGVVLGVVDELRVPIRYIGIGEAVEDLRGFDPEAFCDVLFKPDEDAEA